MTNCVVRGPRGGLSSANVSCDTCVCASRCGFSGPKTRKWGCFDWVGEDGRRVATEKQLVEEACTLSPEDAEATMEPDPPDNGKGSAPLAEASVGPIPEFEVTPDGLEPDQEENHHEE